MAAISLHSLFAYINLSVYHVLTCVYRVLPWVCVCVYSEFGHQRNAFDYHIDKPLCVYHVLPRVYQELLTYHNYNAHTCDLPAGDAAPPASFLPLGPLLWFNACTARVLYCGSSLSSSTGNAGLTS